MDNLIYHYTNAEALKSITLTQTLWITKSDYLNDSSEQIVIQDMINAFFKKYNVDKEFQKHIRQLLNKYMNEYNHYILSFSQSDDALPLWNYYSENEGYNIGIDKEDLFLKFHRYFKNIDEHSQVIKTEVYYSTLDSEERAIQELLLPYIYFSAEDIEKKKDSLNSLALKLANMSYSIKNIAYSSEREERIVVICSKDSSIIKSEKFRILRGSFIPYIVFNENSNEEYRIPIKKIKLSPYHTLDVTQKSIYYFLTKNYKEITVDAITKSKIPSRY